MLKRLTRAVVAIVVIGLVSATLTACATRSDFTAILTKNVNLTSMKLDRKVSKGRTSGEDCQHIIIFIPTGVANPKDAIDRALQAKNANILLDAVLRYHWFYIPYIYGQECWKAEGDAYDTYQ